MVQNNIDVDLFNDESKECGFQMEPKIQRMFPRISFNGANVGSHCFAFHVSYLVNCH